MRRKIRRGVAAALKREVFNFNLLSYNSTCTHNIVERFGPGGPGSYLNEDTGCTSSTEEAMMWLNIPVKQSEISL